MYRKRRSGRYCLVVIFATALLLGACTNDRPWHLHDLSGLMPPLQFTLTDGDGQTVHANKYRGKVILLYFGYTHCPDVCPTTLARLAKAVATLGTGASSVRVLFISVDPKRDRPATLRSYCRYFGPQFVGLSGTDKELRTLTKRYRVTYSTGTPNANGDYEVTHSSAVFIFDTKANIRLLATYQATGDAIAADLQRLLAEG